MPSGIVVPSIPYLSYSLFRLLSTHPLIIQPLVLHPITKKPIKISVYRFMDGFPVGLETDTLACCIIPGAVTSDSQLPGPNSYAVSALYKPYDLGNNHDEVIYHLGIKFYYQEISLPGLNASTDQNLITVPQQAIVDPAKRLLTSLGTTQVQLEINPGFEIIGNYLELTRLAVSDIAFIQDLSIEVRSIEVIHQNLPTSKWDSSTNSFLQHGSLMLRLTAFVSRGWRDKFLLPLEEFNLNIEDDRPISVGGAEAVGSLPSSNSVLVNEPASSTDFINKNEKNVPGGVAGLSSQGFIDPQLIPSQFIDQAELTQELTEFASTLQLQNTTQTYEFTFSDSDLSIAGLLPVAHNFNKLPSTLKLWDGSGNQSYPDSITDTTTNTVIGLASYRPLIGQWKGLLTA